MPTGIQPSHTPGLVRRPVGGTARASARQKGMFAKKIPAPTEPRGEKAPEGRPQCHGDAGDHPHDAEHTGHTATFGKAIATSAVPPVAMNAAPAPLYDAHGQEHRFTQGHPARDRSDEKHRIAGQHAAPATEAVGKCAGRQEGCR